MIKLIIPILLAYSAGVLGANKEIAITFDDAPRAANGYFTGPERAGALIQSLKKHNVGPVAFFAVSNKLDQEGFSRLKQYSDAGHIIGNHTHSHRDINQLSLRQYQRDFLTAHKILSSMEGFQPYFRYPYLREGNTVKKRDGMRDVLEKYGYTNAYITLNNYDWYIEKLFQDAISQHKEVDLGKLRTFYVDVLMESIEYYDTLAKRHLRRSPKHVLLLHEMDISALFIGDLVERLRESGWKIIPLQDAYRDNLAQRTADRLFKFNPGRIGEIARCSGQKKNLWHKSLSEDYLDKRFSKEVIQ